MTEKYGETTANDFNFYGLKNIIERWFYYVFSSNIICAIREKNQFENSTPVYFSLTRLKCNKKTTSENKLFYNAAFPQRKLEEMLVNELL